MARPSGSSHRPIAPSNVVRAQVRPVNTTYPEADGTMAGGTGPAWGMARAAFWGAAMILFARAYCDVQVHPALHRHLTQSGIVIYLVHPVIYPYIVWGLRDGVGVRDTAVLFHASIPLVFAASQPAVRTPHPPGVPSTHLAFELRRPCRRAAACTRSPT